MPSLLQELKRRNVFKVAVAYGIAAWLLIEISATLLPAFEAPDWVLRVIILFIGIGFVLSLILSWAYEMTPEGLKPTHEVDHSESITHVTGRKIDFLIIGVLVLAVGYMFLDNYVLEEIQEPVVISESSTPAAEPAPKIPAQPPQEVQRIVLPNSVAVLPFENLSADPEDAYFAAGIHDEILNQLVKLSALNVIARTSVMQYASTQKTIPAIAEELNVQTVMEGSVRYADDRVLVTAQLIDPVTNAHLWSESYNREFSDVFAIQADIAMNVANALEAEFSLEEQTNIEKPPTDSPEAYRLYLLAGQTGGELGAAYIDQAIEIDPEFALAYVNRAIRNLNLLRFDRTEDGFDSRRADLEARVLKDLDKARVLDPNLGTAYSILGVMHAFNWRGIEAQEAFERAFQTSPNDPAVLSSYSQYFLSWTGEHERSIELAKRASELDPLVLSGALADALHRAGERDSAHSSYVQALEITPGVPRLLTHQGELEAALGKSDEAERTLHLAELANPDNLQLLPQIAYAYGRLGLQQEVERIANHYEQISAGQRIATPSKVWISLARGDEGKALDLLESAAESKEPYDGPTSLMRIKLNVLDDPILDKPEFVEVRNRLGFTDL